MYFQPYGDEQQLNLNWIINEIINLHKQLDPDYETPSFTQVYPYSNLNRLNLDWILSELKALKELAPEPTPPLDIQAVAEALVALPFDSTKSYQIYDYISRDGEIWRATEPISAGGVWDETKWFKTKLGIDLAVLERWINAINNSLSAEIEARQDADTVLQNKIDGEAYIRGKTGVKNLIPFPYTTQSGYTQAGITFTVENDGGITLNGTSTGWCYFTCVRKNFGQSFNSINATGNGTYKAILIGTESAANRVYLGYYQNSLSVQVTVAPNVTIDNLTVYPMICYEEEINVTDFELYAKTNRELTEENESLKGSLNSVQRQITANIQTTLTANKRYVAGDFLVYNRTLYRVTATINSGATITIGTNVEETNIGESIPKIIEEACFTSSKPTQVVAGTDYDLTLDYPLLSYIGFTFKLYSTSTAQSAHAASFGELRAVTASQHIVPFYMDGTLYTLTYSIDYATKKLNIVSTTAPNLYLFRVFGTVLK